MTRDMFVIEAEELLARLDNPNLRLYDASIEFFRKETDPTAHDDYLQSHIPGAAFFDHAQVSDSDSPYEYMVLGGPELSAQIGKIGIDNDSEVVVYASILPSATRAAWVLRYAGHNNVRVLNGGLPAWVMAGGQTEQGERRYPQAAFEGRLRPQMFVGTDEVRAALQDDTARIVNTLMQDSHEEGRIPGSTLTSCMDLMFDMTTFRADDVIRARLEEEARQGRIITYCGGGIAATVNALAHLMTGNENVAVYDGSLYEWMGEGLPVATGAES